MIANSGAPSMTRITPILAALLLAPLPALAVGSDSNEPAPKTETSTSCADGQVFDPNKGECVTAEQSGMNDDALFQAARELAEAGRYESAITVASAMENPESDKALTILGFANRKAGRRELGMALSVLVSHPSMNRPSCGSPSKDHVYSIDRN
jgi:hypothetical protein